MKFVQPSLAGWMTLIVVLLSQMVVIVVATGDSDTKLTNSNLRHRQGGDSGGIKIHGHVEKVSVPQEEVEMEHGRQLSDDDSDENETLNLKVYTRNLYLGTSLANVIGATTQEQLGIALAVAFQNIQDTEYPTRALILAQEIIALDADLIGLQEVMNFALFTDAEYNGIKTFEIDYLSILLTILNNLGATYTAISVNQVNVNPTGFPIASDIGPLQFLRVIDNDVILIKESLKYKVKKEVKSQYTTLFTIPSPFFTLVTGRGYHYVDLKINKKFKFRFANTHIETEVAVQINEAQALEYREAVTNNGKYKKPIIAVGDFNSLPDGFDTEGYLIFRGTDFVDAYSQVNPTSDGFTCCYEGTLSDTSSALVGRIDYILYRDAVIAGSDDDDSDEGGDLTSIASDVVGTTPFQQEQPVFSSDHAGVVATIQFTEADD